MASLRPICKYGTNCYRKNPVHFQEFRHPWKDKDEEENETDRSLDNGTSRKKLKLSHQPGTSSSSSSSSNDHDSTQRENVFGFYFTKVAGIDGNYNNGCTMDISDILSKEHGKLKESMQFNYMFDLDWLVKQYDEEFRNLPLYIVHQDKKEILDTLDAEAAKFSNVKLVRAQLLDPFGTHHTKMMLLHYEKGFRVVIHTANLIQGDWHQKTQGIWLSPIFPPSLNPSCINASTTNFQKDLLEYLYSYKSTEIQRWCNLIKKYDMSSAKVFLIGSSPGRFVQESLYKFGHLKLRNVLSSMASKTDINKDWPVIAQFSSIGTLGATPEKWMTGEFLATLKTIGKIKLEQPPLNIVFPCVEDVRNSLEGYSAGASLPYSCTVAQKQEYLTSFMHRWVSEDKGRTRASPHIKTYCRISPDCQSIGWFLLTSANLSKAAWGTLEKNSSQLAIKSYELGVLFLPQLFGDLPTFKVADALSIGGNGSTEPYSFPLPFDVPLTQYNSNDKPWMWNVPYNIPDARGNVWCP